MLPQINCVLYATDLSPNSQPAFTYAASIAEKYRAKLYVLHVLELVTDKPYLQLEGYVGQADWNVIQKAREAAALKAIRKKLKSMCAEISSNNSACAITEDQIVIRKGHPVEEIMNATVENGAQIIVMGTHGYGVVKDALMGGTARRLVRRSDRPVLIVPHA